MNIIEAYKALQAGKKVEHVLYGEVYLDGDDMMVWAGNHRYVSIIPESVESGWELMYEAEVE